MKFISLFMLLLFVSCINYGDASKVLTAQEAHNTEDFITNDASTTSTMQDSDKSSGYLVEFVTPSVIGKKKDLGNEKLSVDEVSSKIKSHKQKILSEHKKLLSSLNKGQSKNAQKKFKNEFSHVFNGVSLDIDSETAKKIKSMSGIKRVVPNSKVYVNLMDSVPDIRADSVWEDYGYTGAGITVAIIDTGIDYTHPDLGGCLGEGCKVIGGYDFVNEDSDPMDDHGHGTHVAGIVAAGSLGGGGKPIKLHPTEATGNVVLDSSIKGVAPNAKLLSYKVLDQNGEGWSDDIIAGIEQAVLDGADILSISLGGSGNPDDPMSVAVDNAVNSGAIVVVAAGNSGSSENTIKSPGTSRKALTVGAAHKSSVSVAGFSSRGPVSWIDTNGFERMLLKPDIVAPGVSICSSQYETAWDENRCLDDEHTAISGTSMATPHVAGAVALIKNAHPDWTTEEINMALRNGAFWHESFDSQSYGYGILDVYETVSFANPPPIAEITTNGFFTGVIDIMGNAYARGRDFRSYEVYYGSSKNPDHWTLICSGGPIPVESGVLCPDVDMTELDDGIYSLKLITRTLDIVESEDISYILKRDAHISGLGDSLEYLSGHEPVYGKILVNDYDSYTLEYLNQSYDWQPLCNGIEQLTGNLICYIDVSSWDNGKYEFRLSVTKDGTTIYGETKKAVVFKELLDGWPIEILGFPNGRLNLLESEGQKKVIVPHWMECGVSSNKRNIFDTNNNLIMETQTSNVIFSNSDETVSAQDWCSEVSLYIYEPNGSFNWITRIGEYNVPYDDLPVVHDDKIGFIPNMNQLQYSGIITLDGLPYLEWDSQKYGETLTVFNDIFYYIKFDYFTGEIFLNAREADGSFLPSFPLNITHEESQYSLIMRMPRVYYDNGIKILVLRGNYDIIDGTMINLSLYSEIYSLSGQLIKRTDLVSELPYKVQLSLLHPVIGDLNKDNKPEIVISAGLFNLDMYSEDKYNPEGYNPEGYETHFFVLDSSGEIINSFESEKGYLIGPGLAIGGLNSGNPSLFATLQSTWATQYMGDKVVSYDYLGNQGLNESVNTEILLQGLVIGDVDADSESEILVNYRPRWYGSWYEASPSGIIIYNLDGTIQKNIEIHSTGLADDYWSNHPLLTDLNNDGKLDIIQQTLHVGEERLNTRIFAYTLNTNFNPNTLEWPMEHRDPQHTANYHSGCSNGIIEGIEECDDGNMVNGDRCNDKCQLTSTGRNTKYIPKQAVDGIE